MSALADIPGWRKSDDLGANVVALRDAKVPWRAIAEMARDNGHDIPWPDGGKLKRAMLRYLDGKPAPVVEPRRKQHKSPEPRTEFQPLTQREINDMKSTLPWDGESTDEELLAAVEGRVISYVSAMTGKQGSAHVPRGGRHTEIKRCKHGVYISFAETNGPFRSILFDRIIHVS